MDTSFKESMRLQIKILRNSTLLMINLFFKKHYLSLCVMNSVLLPLTFFLKTTHLHAFFTMIIIKLTLYCNKKFISDTSLFFSTCNCLRELYISKKSFFPLLPLTLPRNLDLSLLEQRQL